MNFFQLLLTARILLTQSCSKSHWHTVGLNPKACTGIKFLSIHAYIVNVCIYAYLCVYMCAYTYICMYVTIDNIFAKLLNSSADIHKLYY